ncbi:Wall-associated receptor kinase 5 [Bienertia sinuspersici]
MLKINFGWKYHTLLTNFATLAMAILCLGFQGVGAQVGPTSQIALPNCPEKCGDVTIPYPFGIGDKCHYNHPQDGSFFDINCNASNIPKYGVMVVEKITVDGEIRVQNDISYVCYQDNGTRHTTISHTWRTSITRFAISTTENMIGAIGCDTYAVFSGTRMDSSSSEFLTGCVTGCKKQSDVGTSCSGVGCCEVSMPKGVTNISVNASSMNQHKDVKLFNPCSIAFVVAKDQGQSDQSLPFPIQSIITKDATYFSDQNNLLKPVVYHWSVGTKKCEEAKLDKEYYLCKGNSVCLDLPEQWGYRCECQQGFRGNPYLHDCQGVGGGLIVCLIIAFYMHWQHGKRELKKSRENFFHQNGGHILQQKLKGTNISVGSTVEMFTIEELKKATDNFSQNSEIGKGGFGMVYKGNLTRKTISFPNNQIVAIKKSLKVDKTQVEQFINEIIALSQINNKNVVRILGCCLETEMPLLVYEYISNGTLQEHLRDESKACFLTWDVRLKIAIDVSEVLAYLHTTLSIPIIHRDIKSANILLDENYIAKVADFGASKLAPVDHEQLATTVQGTWGYLDPEYMQSGELTAKSDVYSFGVVLAELLTRKKAISYLRLEEDRNLSFFFLRKLNEGRLSEILDEKLVNGIGDGAKAIIMEQLEKVSLVAKRCLEVKADDRPTMKEVARELDGIKSEISSHPRFNNESLRPQEESENSSGEAKAYQYIRLWQQDD